MAAINSMREFHDELDVVCSSLESLFDLCSSDHEKLCLAASPAMSQFRELLDQADSLAGVPVVIPDRGRAAERRHADF